MEIAQKLSNLINSYININGKSNNDTNDAYSIESSEDYCQFRSNIPLRRYVLDDNDNEKTWSIYECGPKDNKRNPVIFLPPASGSADIYFNQLKYLSNHGYRVISAEYPSYFLVNDFIDGFKKFLEYFNLENVHIFGASLGGFLAQKFAQVYPKLVASLILCNSFADTSRFKFLNTAPLVWLNPSSVIRKIFVTQLIPDTQDVQILNAGKFMSSRLNNFSHEQLISRLYLNLTDNYVRPENLQSIPITIIDVFDECANSENTREELYKMYPNARLAHLKSGGNFPYLSRPDQVNLHLLVHLRKFLDKNEESCHHSNKNQ